MTLEALTLQHFLLRKPGHISPSAQNSSVHGSPKYVCMYVYRETQIGNMKGYHMPA